MKKVGPGKDVGWGEHSPLVLIEAGLSCFLSMTIPKVGKVRVGLQLKCQPSQATPSYIVWSSCPPFHVRQACTLLFYEGLHLQHYSFCQGSFTHPAPKNQQRSATKCTHINYFDGSCQFAPRSWKILKGSGWIWPHMLSPTKHWNILFAELYTSQSTLTHWIFTGISNWVGIKIWCL